MRLATILILSFLLMSLCGNAQSNQPAQLPKFKITSAKPALANDNSIVRNSRPLKILGVKAIDSTRVTTNTMKRSVIFQQTKEVKDLNAKFGTKQRNL